MITIDFLKNHFSILPNLIDVKYPDSARGWIDQVYYPRKRYQTKVKFESLCNTNGLKILSRDWREIGDALLEDDKTRGQYIYANTTHIDFEIDNSNYFLNLSLYNPNVKDKKIDIYVNQIFEKTVVLPKKENTSVNLKTALSQAKFDLCFIDHNCREGMTNNEDWVMYLQKISLEKEIIDIDDKIGIYIASDSTAQTYSLKEEPQSGWGEELYHQLKGNKICISNSSFYPQATKYELSNIFVDNRSMGARSSKSFILEGRLEAILQDIKKGDYLLIQFGDNDATSYRPNRFVAPNKFAYYIKQYIEGALSRGAKPILCSPPTQFKFDTKKKSFITTFDDYAEIMRNLSKEYQIPMIELGRKMTQLLNKMGYCSAHVLFLQVNKEDYPNLDQSKTDITHFQHYGAFTLAQIISNQLKQIIGSTEFISTNYNQDLRPQINKKLHKILLQWANIPGADFYIIKDNRNYLFATTNCRTYVDLPKNWEKKSYEILAFNNLYEVVNKQVVFID